MPTTIPQRRRRVYATPVYHYEGTGTVITADQPAESWPSYVEPVLVFSSITITAGIAESWATALAPTLTLDRLNRDVFEANFEMGLAVVQSFAIVREVEYTFER